jgi:two-component system, OmpR family, sensor histidine kinase MprB
MSFRRRVVLLSGLAVALAVAAVSIVTYVLVRGELRARVDDELKHDVTETFATPIIGSSKASRLRSGAPGADRGHVGTVPAGGPATGKASPRLFSPTGPLGGRSVYAQVVYGNGSVIRPRGPRTDLGGVDTAAAVAAGDHRAYFTDVDTAGLHLRVYTAQLDKGQAIEVARPLDEVDSNLRHLAVILALACAAGIVLGGGLGYLVSRAAVAPVQRLRRTAEEVATTGDLSRRIDGSGQDELAALARSFNQMLAALEGSVDAQRQLVADASHELRTPLASIRTNAEVLAQSDLLTDTERRAILADVIEQLGELTALVSDLIDLARDADHEREPPTPVRLDTIASQVAERFEARHPEVGLQLDLEPSAVLAVSSQLERAITNLLDNAVKWSPPAGEIEVRVAGGELSVRDHGPGIDPEDMPHVFDRFYRSPHARGTPGSGLGLAIVRHVAEIAGGSVSASNDPDGGARLSIRLPLAEAAVEVPTPA